MKEEHVFDNPQNVKRFVTGFYLFVAVLMVVDLILPKHAFFPWEGYPFFYGAYGFLAYVAIVFGSHFILRKALMRSEDYYD